jgi:hypothetical protein
MVVKSVKPVWPLIIPPPRKENNWIILGLDPSLSRTGFSILQVALTPDGVTQAQWLAAGSIKPESSKDPIWIRGKAMSKFLYDKLLSTVDVYGSSPDDSGVCFGTGLIISMEYPTPMDDFLVALNRILHLVLLDGVLPSYFSSVQVLTTNASTLRSLMKLTQRGNKNKGENIQRAYDFINKASYPQLDSDACDAVLLAMMARHTAAILLGRPQDVPEQFLYSLCTSKQETKGKGRNARLVTKGLLHTTGQRPEYWYPYTRQSFTLAVKDAASPKKTLQRVSYYI